MILPENKNNSLRQLLIFSIYRVGYSDVLYVQLNKAHSKVMTSASRCKANELHLAFSNKTLIEVLSLVGSK